MAAARHTIPGAIELLIEAGHRSAGSAPTSRIPIDIRLVATSNNAVQACAGSYTGLHLSLLQCSKVGIK